MTEEDSEDRFRQVVYGIAAAATMTYGAWAGVQINSINDRLTRIETTMAENRSERQLQVEYLRHRIERIEAREGGK